MIVEKIFGHIEHQRDWWIASLGPDIHTLLQDLKLYTNKAHSRVSSLLEFPLLSLLLLVLMFKSTRLWLRVAQVLKVGIWFEVKQVGGSEVNRNKLRTWEWIELNWTELTRIKETFMRYMFIWREEILEFAKFPLAKFETSQVFLV